MGLQAAGGVARGLQQAMLRNAQGRRQQQQQERQGEQQQLEDILTLLQLRQQPGVEVTGPDTGPAETTEASFGSEADPLSAIQVPDQGADEVEGEQLASSQPFAPPEGEGRTEADLLAGFTVADGEGADGLSEAAEELGEVELAGETRRIFFDPVKAAERSTAEARREQLQQEAAFDILKSREPDQFPEFVPGFDYLGELDEVLTEEREARREGAAADDEEVQEARRDRAFRLLRQGRNVEQVADMTGMPANEVGDIAKDVRQLEEEPDEDLPTQNVLDIVDPRDPFEEEVARRIAQGQTPGEIMQAIQLDVAKAGESRGADQESVSREQDRLVEKANEVFRRLQGGEDVTISGDFESVGGLLRGGG